MATKLFEQDFELVRLRIKQAYDAMDGFMEGCPDWTAVEDVREEFRSLRDKCWSFAHHQYGLRRKQRKMRRRAP